MSKLAEYLNKQIVGNVFERQTICEAYATDRSILKITPRLVAIPENVEDVQRLFRFVNQLARRELRLPITLRGTGLDKTGASIGDGMIVSMEKLNQIEEIDVRGRLVRVQPGVKLGELNAALKLHGLWLPIGYNEEATIGGLIANCPHDDMMARYGGIYHFVERAEMVLPSGDLILLTPYSSRAVEAKIKENTAEGLLYSKINQILDEQADTILDRSMRPYDARGYANIIHVHEDRTINLLPLMFASQGTLGAVTDVILKVEPLPPQPRKVLMSFHDLKAAQRFLNYACDLEPYLLKIYDLRILEAALAHGKRSDLFTRKYGKGVLIMAGFDYYKMKTSKRLRDMMEALPDNALRVEEDEENAADFREIENLLMSYLNDDGKGQRAPVLDDVFVPSFSFGEFIEGLTMLEATLGMELPVYGSFVTSNYTVRPDFDMTDISERKRMIDFLKLYTEIVESCQGSITGNGPEGQVKALMMTKTLGVGERQLYTAIKEAFDPNDILNPHVKMGADVRGTVRYLRTSEKLGVITP